MGGELIRVGVALDTTGLSAGVSRAEREFNRVATGASRIGVATRSAGAAVADAALPVDLLRDRFSSLQQQYRLGVIGAVEYAGGLRTLKADIAGLAQTTQLGAESQMLLARTGQQVNAGLLQVSGISQRMAGGMMRGAFGVDMLARSMEAGRFSASGFGAAMMTMSLGNPALMAILAGLAALATAWSVVSRRAEAAAKAVDEAAEASRTGAIARVQSVGADRPSGDRLRMLRSGLAETEAETRRLESLGRAMSLVRQRGPAVTTGRARGTFDPETRTWDTAPLLGASAATQALSSAIAENERQLLGAEQQAQAYRQEIADLGREAGNVNRSATRDPWYGARQQEELDEWRRKMLAVPAAWGDVTAAIEQSRRAAADWNAEADRMAAPVFAQMERDIQANLPPVPRIEGLRPMADFEATQERAKRLFEGLNQSAERLFSDSLMGKADVFNRFLESLKQSMADFLADRAVQSFWDMIGGEDAVFNALGGTGPLKGADKALPVKGAPALSVSAAPLAPVESPGPVEVRVPALPELRYARPPVTPAPARALPGPPAVRLEMPSAPALRTPSLPELRMARVPSIPVEMPPAPLMRMPTLPELRVGRMPAAPLERRSAPASAPAESQRPAGPVLHQRVNVTVQSLDPRTAAQVLRDNRGAVAEAIARATTESRYLQSAFRGER